MVATPLWLGNIQKCYVDWVVTTLLIVLKFPQLLGNVSKGSGIATMVIVADVMVILLGYIGETAIKALKISDFNLIRFAMFRCIYA